MFLKEEETWTGGYNKKNLGDITIVYKSRGCWSSSCVTTISLSLSLRQTTCQNYFWLELQKIANSTSMYSLLSILNYGKIIEKFGH